MEIWDAYLPNGTLAGCDLVRGEPIPEGLRHLVSEILVRHTKGDYLLMQRDFRKPNYGGYYEATAGGSALKDEDAITCARRELQEETGINARTLTNIGLCMPTHLLLKYGKERHEPQDPAVYHGTCGHRSHSGHLYAPEN